MFLLKKQGIKKNFKRKKECIDPKIDNRGKD